MTLFTKLGAFEINKAAATDRPSSGIEWSKKPTSPAPRWMVRSADANSIFNLIKAAKLTGDNSTVFHYTAHATGREYDSKTTAEWSLPVTRARVYVDANGLLSIMATLTESITYRPGHKRPEKITAFFGGIVSRTIRLGK